MNRRESLQKAGLTVEADTALYPGFNSDWSNQPYYVIRQSRPTT